MPQSLIPCLTIAGLDPSGGAGIIADLKTFAALGCYGQAAVTAVTVQSSLGVSESVAMDGGLVYRQAAAVMDDFMPVAVKTGMLGNTAVVQAVTKLLREYKPEYVVVDPVMLSTSGMPLLDAAAVPVLQKELLPLSTLVTPNLPEAETLLRTAGMDVTGFTDTFSGDNKEGNEEEKKEWLHRLSQACGGAAVLLKGGHAEGAPTDYLYYNGDCHAYSGKRIASRNTHGTGCTLSSAIAAHLAR
ncbi:MAG: bifunctional hydroxymethylpyrimidine kinase/phosphomethylpyrimidine kinase, partial [Bacteroidales bacterium]